MLRLVVIDAEIAPISDETLIKYQQSGYEIYLYHKLGIKLWDGKSYNSCSISISDADIILTAIPLSVGFVNQLKQNAIVIGSLDPYWHHDVITALAEKSITAFSLDLISRSTRAQCMDILSSQANLAGYRSVIEATYHLNRSMPLMITSAGTLPAVNALIIGAGVAGLQAIATAKRLGAHVCAFDVRSSAKEQVESLGAKFIDIATEVQGGTYATEVSDAYKLKQQEVLQNILPSQDIVITTAQIPHKTAPIIITRSMYKLMKRDAVIVDLASKHGGNCELPSEGYPKLLRYDNILKYISKSASLLYAKNAFNFVKYIEPFMHTKLDQAEDEIITSTLLTYNGQIVNKTFIQNMQHHNRGLYT